MPNKHIVRSFSDDLQRLSNLIAQMGGAAEAQIEAAVQAVAHRDMEMAAEVVRADNRIDRYEREVDGETVRLLALRQPLGGDLREIVAALKIAADLERIGDYAANIGKRAMVLAQVPYVQPTGTIPRMGKLVQEIMKDVLDAYIERDVEKAVAAWQRDEELDDLYTALFRETLTYMMEDPRNITACTHIIFIAKNLERVGDHATNIAENIYFAVMGSYLKTIRPKSDTSSYIIVGTTADEDAVTNQDKTGTMP